MGHKVTCNQENENTQSADVEAANCPRGDLGTKIIRILLEDAYRIDIKGKRKDLQKGFSLAAHLLGFLNFDRLSVEYSLYLFSYLYYC